MPPRAPSDPPSQIGRYIVKAVVGEGAMGRVYRVYDPQLERAAAIKVVRIAADLPADVLGAYTIRFRNEARAAARLRHPNIVGVYDVSEMPDGTPYLVLEFVQGESLRAFLKRQGRLEPPRTLLVIDAVASALDHAHRVGIVHRDVKPDNILLGLDGSVKLADFGVARLPDAELTQRGQFLGTPGYAAPESLARGDYSPLADLFGLAVVTYELLAGERPWRGEDAMSIAQQVLHAQPPSLRSRVDETPPAADEAIRRALAKDPADRFPSAGAFSRALRAAYERTLLETTGRHAAAPGGGHGGWIALALGGLALVGLLAVVVSAIVGPSRLDAGDGPDASDAADLGGADARADTLPAATGDGSLDDGGARPRPRPIDVEERIKDLLDEARDAQRRGDAAAARTAVDQVLRLDPRHPEALRLRSALAP